MGRWDGLTPEKRFWSKVDKTGDCWLWTGATSKKGYGVFRSGEGKVVQAHRWAYEQKYGPIPQRMDIDHIDCVSRRCVRPRHLRIATNKHNQENRRGARRDSASGVRGVIRNHKRWMARVIHHRRSYYVGTFDTIAEAEAAVIAKRMELFTHNERDRT